MTRDELIRNMAEIIAGLEVPYSLNRRLLGTAGPAWSRVYGNIGLHIGYASAEEIEAKLRKILDETA